jgi:hypothetical protein
LIQRTDSGFQGYPHLMRRIVHVTLVGAIAAPLLYQGLWQIVFRLWPPACEAPDGSQLPCIVATQYTEPRDLTAGALSFVLGIAIAAGVRAWIARSEGRTRMFTQ